METDSTRMCALLVGLPEVAVLGVDDRPGEPIVVHVEQGGARQWCHSCGSSRVKDRDEVVLVDLPCVGRPARLCWHKFRLCCPDRDCEMGSWTWEGCRIAVSRQVMTADRDGRWATWQVGKLGRTVAEVAREMGCDWRGRRICAVGRRGLAGRKPRSATTPRRQIWAKLPASLLRSSS